jgi:predicted amidohydrolase YtcJ
MNAYRPVPTKQGAGPADLSVRILPTAKKAIREANTMAMAITRRSALLASAAALSGAFGGTTAVVAQAPQPADRIWTNGRLYTMNDAQMRAEAVAERGGRIVAVGSAADVMRLRGPQTRVVDLAGRAMVPGFIDPHGHIVFGGLQALSANLLAPPDGEVTDIASLQKVLRDWIAANAEAVRKANLIVGFGYDNSQLKELRHPTRDDLDQVSRDVPILLVHQSSHLAALNSKALEVAGITAATPNPAGGVIRRKPNSQEPDGVLEETAFVPAALKLISGIGVEGMKTFAKAGSELWARFGYTTAQEGRASPQIADIVRTAASEGAFKNDVAVYVDVQTNREYIAANASTTYVNRMRVAGAKLSLDGTPQGFTAYRDRPYYDPVGNYPPGYQGYATVPLEEAIRLVDWCYQNRVQVITHANGEAASDMYITAVKTAVAKHGRSDRRTVLIHGQFLREAQVDAYKSLDVIPSLFPIHTFYWGDWHLDHTVGPQLADNISPTGWLRQRGMIFTSHHDAPVAFPDSMRVLDATVTRRTRSGDILGPAQRVDVITALKAMTLWAAYQYFEEKDKGSIEVGKLADLVILSDDPVAVSPNTINRIRVVETIKEGQTIFALDAQQQRRGDLMLPRDRRDNPLNSFVNTASAYRDVIRSNSPFAKANPRMYRAVAAAPHDHACIARLFDDIVAGAFL